MRLRFPAALSVVFALALTAPAHAVVVHGLEYTPVGAASLSSVVLPSSPSSQMLASEIGSSGQDGCSLALPSSSGIQVTFGERLSPTPIVHCDLSLRSISNTPVIRGSAHITISGCDFSVVSPLATEMLVEIWDSSTGRCNFSKLAPISSVVTALDATDAAPPGSSMWTYTAKTGKSGATKRCVVEISMPTARYHKMDGIDSYYGDRVVFQIESSSIPDLNDVAVLRAATPAGPPGSLLVSVASVVQDPPLTAPQHAHSSVAVTLSDGAMFLPDAAEGAISYTATGGGGGGGGAGGMVLSMRGVAAPDGAYVRARRNKWGMGGAAAGMEGIPVTTEMVLDCDDNSGLPPQQFTAQCDWTLSASGTGDGSLTASTTIPTGSCRTQARDAQSGLAVGRIVPVGSGVQCSNPPTACAVSNDPAHTQMEYRFPPGTVITLDGEVPVSATAVVLTFPSSTQWNRRISDVRIVHPPGTPPGIMRITNVGTSTTLPTDDTGGRDLAARGPRQTVSLDGSYGGGLSKHLVIKNLGSSGEDGPELALRGAPSASFDLHTEPGDIPLQTMELNVFRCPLGDCDVSTSLHIATGTSIRFTAIATFADGSSAPRFVQVGNEILPLSSCDLDGDGAVELITIGPGEPSVSRMAYRWLSPYSECLSLHLSSPMQIQCDSGPVVVQELHFWRNPSGTTVGGPSSQPESIRLNGLPPGTPVKGTLSIAPVRLSPPGVHVSGHDVGSFVHGDIRAGVIVGSTWAQVSGPLRVTGEPDGKLTLLRTGPDVIPIEDPPVLSASSSSDACPGFVFERRRSYAPVTFAPLQTLRMECDADIQGQPPGQMLHGLELDSDGGALPRARYVGGAAGGGVPIVKLFFNGVVVASGPAEEVELSELPEFVVVDDDMDDSDPDGVPDIVCRGFSPTATASFGGLPPIAIDRLGFQPASDVTVTTMTTARMRFDGVPVGVAIGGLTIAQMMAPGVTTGVTPRLPVGRTLELRGIAPNPARGISTLRLALGERARVRVEVLDVAGRAVATLAESEMAAGEHALEWSGRTRAGLRAAPGLYLLRVSGDGLRTQTTRLVRLD